MMAERSGFAKFCSGTNVWTSIGRATKQRRSDDKAGTHYRSVERIVVGCCFDLEKLSSAVEHGNGLSRVPEHTRAIDMTHRKSKEED